jgi:predicted ArsR family transcriptional regulator
MSNFKSEELRKIQYERRMQICQWLSEHEGTHSAVDLSNALGLPDDTIRTNIIWLERHDLVGQILQMRPQKRRRYFLLKPMRDVEFELKSEHDENKSVHDQWVDDEHLAWMAKYRQAFVDRRLRMNLPIPQFTTDC